LGIFVDPILIIILDFVSLFEKTKMKNYSKLKPEKSSPILGVRG
jgi:hypothetical protein